MNEKYTLKWCKNAEHAKIKSSSYSHYQVPKQLFQKKISMISSNWLGGEFKMTYEYEKLVRNLPCKINNCLM